MVRDALVVGINTYKHIQSLQAPAHDAEAIAHLLLEYGEFQVKRLPETVDQGQLQVGKKTPVSQDDLEEALIRLFNPDGSSIPDTALFYFSGHGMRVSKGGVSEGFLVTSDGDKRCWGISFKWLQELLAKSPVQQKVVILDCCHSGEFITSLNLLSSSSWQGRDRCFIAASREFESSWEDLDSPLSTVTKILVDGLDPRRHQKPVFTSIDLIQYLYDYLDGATQRPIHQTHGHSIDLTRSTAQDEDLTKAERLAKDLWVLDYVEASGHHEQVLARYDKTCAFLISTPSIRIQRWLVKRLVREFDQFTVAKILSIKPSNLELRSGEMIDCFCQELADALQVEYDSEENLINAILEQSQTQLVLIAIYEVEDLGDFRFLEEFLRLLLVQGQQQSTSYCKGVFVYVIGNVSQEIIKTTSFICSADEVLNNSSYNSMLVRLSDLNEISKFDVIAWLKKASVRKNARDFMTEEEINKIIRETVHKWPTEPEKVFERICKIFQLEFSDIEQYWKLEKAG